MKHLFVDIGIGILEPEKIRQYIEDLDGTFEGEWHVSLIANKDQLSWTLKLMSKSGKMHQLDLSEEQQNEYRIQIALLALKSKLE